MTRRFLPGLLIALGVLALGLLVAFTVGRYPVTLAELIEVLVSRLMGRAAAVPPAVENVVLLVRGPRVVAAVLVGGALAVAGTAFQGLFRNPLVSPDILGASSGAALGAVLGIYFSLGVIGIEGLAFAGGLVAVAAVYVIGSLLHSRDPILVLVLTGVVVGALLGAGVGLVKYLADPYNQLPAMTFWLLGSLAATTVADLLPLTGPVAVGTIVLIALRWRLNVMSLPEDEARALEIAAAGGHHLLMIGSPGAGKSMLAARLPSILPPLSPSELLEVSMIASVAGEIEGGALTNRRPFRAPHHSASMPALVGGGLRARPGEISLSHNGVLFLDELAEFSGQVLDSLRQPLETGEVAIARANHRVTYPARFMLVAAMNPCRCGHAYEPGYSCKRGRIDRCTADYQMRISGPLMDRIDLRIEVPAVTAADLILPPPSEGSAEVAARVAAARDIQLARFAAAGMPNIRTNAEAPASLLETIAQPDAAGQKLLRDAAETMHLTARGYHRVLRVARTLADLDGAGKIGRLHLAEALSYRALADDLRRAA